MSQPIIFYDVLFVAFWLFQETVISELDEEKGNFLCGPEWKVKITTKAGQELDIKQVLFIIFYSIISIVCQQIEDGEDFRVLISPLPPKLEEVKEEKKVVKKKNDNRSANNVSFTMQSPLCVRYLYSGGKIYFSECRLYYKPPPGVPYLKAIAQM